MLGTFFLIDYFCFISCFFRGFSVLWIEKKKSFVFSFCLTFSIAMKSLKTVTYSCLERVSSCQNVSNSLQNQWFWWKTRIWSDHELHLPTEYAGSYHLGRTCPEDWGTRCRARVSPLLSVCLTIFCGTLSTEESSAEAWGANAGTLVGYGVSVRGLQAACTVPSL